MNLPIDTFRIINQYISFHDKYKICSLSQELQCIILEDLSMSVDDIIFVFNDGDMNQIQFALKYCMSDIDLKLHECIDHINNLNSIIFIVQEFLRKICKFLQSEIYPGDNSDFSKIYDEDSYDTLSSDDEYSAGLVYYFISTEHLEPRNEYERRLNTLLSIVRRVGIDPKYYDLIQHTPEIIFMLDYEQIFVNIIKTPDKINTIDTLFRYRSCNIKLTNEIFKDILQLHDINFDTLFDGNDIIFESNDVKIFIDNFTEDKKERISRIIEVSYIKDFESLTDVYIKQFPISLINI